MVEAESRKYETAFHFVRRCNFLLKIGRVKVVGVCVYSYCLFCSVVVLVFVGPKPDRAGAHIVPSLNGDPLLQLYLTPDVLVQTGPRMGNHKKDNLEIKG